MKTSNFWLTDAYKNRCILLRNNHWSIEAYTSETTGNPSIAVISSSGVVDHPVIYWHIWDRNKRVAFDRPEMLPQYILNAVKSFIF